MPRGLWGSLKCQFLHTRCPPPLAETSRRHSQYNLVRYTPALGPSMSLPVVIVTQCMPGVCDIRRIHCKRGPSAGPPSFYHTLFSGVCPLLRLLQVDNVYHEVHATRIDSIVQVELEVVGVERVVSCLRRTNLDIVALTWCDVECILLIRKG